MPERPVRGGDHIVETPSGVPTIFGVPTAVTAFVGTFRTGPPDKAVRVHSMADFDRIYGGLERTAEASYAVLQFFLNGGQQAWIVRVEDGGAAADAAQGGVVRPGVFRGMRAVRTGLFALEAVDVFNILCIPQAALMPGDDMRAVYADAERYAEERRAMLLVDIPVVVQNVDHMQAWLAENESLRHPNGVVYFPRTNLRDPLDGGRVRSIGSSGTIAGLYARTDAQRGVWKTPAGTGARLHNVESLGCRVTDADSDVLSRLGVNALRTFPVHSHVCWGGRTLEGADGRASDFKYISVRRTTLFLEESLSRGTRWAASEPNDESLWSRIRLGVGAFMGDLFRQGAFQGSTPGQAYFVRCDAGTTTPPDIGNGIVNIEVGFAPLKPAEFIIIRIQQRARRPEA